MDAELEESLQEFLRSGNPGLFLNRSARWIVEYCQNRLTHDPDTVGDFYLYFYERAHLCLERYKVRQHLPFTGYLATYLRHEFYNFRRKARRNIQPVLLECMEDIRAEHSASPSEARINDLAPDVRLAYKLHTGLRLDLEDLRLLVELAGDAHRASVIVNEFQQKLEQNHNRALHLQKRAVSLFQKLETESDPLRYARFKRWKGRALELLGRTAIVFSVTELSKIFQVNKSTISRRLRSAQSMIQLRAQEA